MARFLATLVAVGLISSTVSANLVDFDSEPLGTQYGTPAGHAPGTVVLTQAGIDMSVHDFEWFPSGSGTTFGSAEIVAPPSSFAPNATQALHTNNINAQFDLTGLPFAVTTLSLEFIDLGGNSNFDLNGIGLTNVNNITALGPYPGFNVSVASVPIGGGVRGEIHIQQTGPDSIQKVLIGGQEFGIDNIKVVPEPSGLMVIVLGLMLLSSWRRLRG